MRRVFGAIAVFVGWLCIALGGVAGFVTGSLVRLDQREGDLGATSVYGVDGIVIFWLFIFVALATSVPLVYALFADDATRPLYTGAIVMGAVGLALLPDELGRLYALLLFPGAFFIAGGAWMMRPQPAIAGPASAEVPDPEPSAVVDVGELARLGYATGFDTVVPAADEAAAVETPATEAPAPAAAPEPVGTDVSAPPEPVAAFVEPEPGPEAAAEPAPELAAVTASEEAGADTTPCPWCSEPVPAGATSCPSCHASLEAPEEVESMPIPGVTAISPEFQASRSRAVGKKRKAASSANVFGWLSRTVEEPYGTLDGKTAALPPDLTRVDASAFEPPNAAVRAEMARIELELSGALPPAEEPLAEETPAEAEPVAETEAGAGAATPTESAVIDDAPAAAPARRSRGKRRAGPPTEGAGA